MLARGLGASPGAAVGRVYLTADDAQAAAERGEQVVLVRSETSPEDVHGMLAAEGILTARGGLVSHAAVVARGWGKPAVVGAEAAAHLGARSFAVGDTVVNEGDWISVDGTNGTVVLGQVPVSEGETPPEFETILGWADEIRAGHLGVRANADNGPDAANARTARGRGHRPVPDRAHVPGRGPPAHRAPDDPGLDPGRGGGGPRGAAGGPAGRLRGDPRGHGRAAR